MFKDGGEKQAKRLDDLVSRALLNDLQGQGSHLALELPEIDLEATVLSRLAILEVLCKSQAQTISILQAENSRLTSLAASTSKTEREEFLAKLPKVVVKEHLALIASNYPI
ncbi:hypothetical protein WJX79_006066 [Trebouxia sp. C0005]